MSDISNVRMFLGYGLIFFTTNVVQMTAITVLLFFLNWKLAFIGLASSRPCSPSRYASAAA